MDDLEREVAALERAMGPGRSGSDNAQPLSTTLAAILGRMGVVIQPCRRVLIVDDEPDNLDVLEALLEQEVDLLRAASGPEALAVLAKSGPVDMVISDQRMPGMSGIELLSRLAVTAPETIRIVLTAYADVEPIAEAVNRGAVFRFLLKPWDSTILRGIVREGLALKTRRTVLARLLEALVERRAELAKKQEERERIQNQLVAAERIATLGRITSGITHDINNQLSAMLFLIEALRRPGQSAVLRNAAESAVDSLESLLLLVQDINAFARQRTAVDPGQTGEPSIEIQSSLVAVGPFLEDTFALLLLEPACQGRPLSAEVDPATAALRMDANRARQALLSLLRNAAMASPPGEPISVRVRLAESCPVFEVLDHGTGMDTETLERASEPFFSAFEPRGLGLGLGIAELVARAHGGEITLVSVRGHGTLATMRFSRDSALVEHEAR